MNERMIEGLMTIIAEIVNADCAWQEKRDAIAAYLLKDMNANIAFNEFWCWFEEPEESEKQ